MTAKDGLDLSFAQPQHLTFAFCDELGGVKRQPPLPRMVRDNQGNTKRSLASEFMFFGKIRKGFKHGYSAAAATNALLAKMGSNSCAASHLTTGTATPSPAR